MRRVAVTGIGAISALGHNAREFWEALAAGRCGIGPIEQCDVSAVRFKNAAQVRGYRPEDHFEAKKIDFIDRFAQFAVIAGREAVAQAGIVWTDELREQTAIVTGACVGGQTTEDIGFHDLYANNSSRVNPLTIPRVMANSGASALSMELGVTGPAWTVSTACASSAHAIGQAFQMVRSGAAELAIAGGSEAPFSYGHLKAWEAMRVVSPDTCRPFSRDRTGMVLGEGGAMLALEPLDAALARGAEVLGEIAGFGMSADAHHVTQPSAEGAARAMRAALRDAGMAPGVIGYINAHGTATSANDVTEARAIRAVFGDRTPLVSSTKSMHGHTLGAAGALEGIASIEALRHGVIPPTVNWRVEDPEIGLDVCPNQPRDLRVDYAMSNSFAFGGLNAVLVLKARSGA